MTGQPIVPESIISLSLIVWLIYTFDHLFDATKIKTQAILPRHKFHQKHIKAIGIAWLVIGALSSIFIYNTLNPIAIYLGIGLGLFVFFHFLLLNIIKNKVSLLIQKELGIATIYAVGITIPALSLSPFSLTCPIWIIIGQVFLLAATNLIEFSLFEMREDTLEQQPSIVRALGKPKAEVAIKGLLTINFVMGLMNLIYFQTFEIVCAEAILMIMNLILFIIFQKQKYFRINENYRVLGDFVFILPGVLYFLI